VVALGDLVTDEGVTYVVTWTQTAERSGACPSFMDRTPQKPLAFNERKRVAARAYSRHNPETFDRAKEEMKRARHSQW
jgi:hypothetical protein